MEVFITNFAVCSSLILALLLPTWQKIFVVSQKACTEFPVVSAENISPILGENLTIFCTVAATLENLTRTWYFDNSSSIININIEMDHYELSRDVSERCSTDVLFIRSVSSQDSGQYWCSVGANLSDPIDINVLIPFNTSYPSCSVNDGQHLLAQSGDVVELSCRAPASTPSWHLQWQKTSRESTESIASNRDSLDGFDVLTASLTVTQAKYHKALLQCFAYCPYFPDASQCGGPTRSSCALGTFYVTDVPLDDIFDIAPMDPYVREGESLTFTCTITGVTSDGPTTEFIRSSNRSLIEVPLPNGYAAVINDVAHSDNQTVIGCGLFFMGELYRIKYSTITVELPLTTTINPNETALGINGTDMHGVNVTDATIMVTETSAPYDTTNLDSLNNATSPDGFSSATKQTTDFLSSTSDLETTSPFPPTSTVAPSPTEHINIHSSAIVGMNTTDINNETLSFQTLDTATTIPTGDSSRNNSKGPSLQSIGLIAGCSAAGLLFIIVMIITGITWTRKSTTHRGTWTPDYDAKPTYWDYKDSKKLFNIRVLNGRVICSDINYDFDGQPL